MQKRVFASLAALSLSLTACGTGLQPVVSGAGLSGINTFGRAPSKAGAKAWTILVHLAADNNLYRFGLEDINEMEAGLTNDNVNVIVLFDGSQKGDSAIYKIKHDPAGKNTTIISDKVDDKGAVIPSSKEIDSGDVNTAVKFSKWAVANYPAEKYAEFFWDHGSGIFGKGKALPTKGFCWDDNGHNLHTSDLTTILGATAAAAGKPVEIFGFDCCLMSTVEMAYQAKGIANFMVASEELEPGAGWDYVATMKALSANPAMNGGALGKAMAQSYLDSYKPNGSQNTGGRAVEATLASVDVNAVVGKLTPALNNLASAMSAAYPTAKAALDSLRQSSITFDNTDCADLGDFLKNGATANVPAAVKCAIADTQAAYNASIVFGGGVGSPTHEKATGLVIYYPRPDQSFNPVYANPANIAFGAEGWTNFLKASHKASDVARF